MSPRPGQASRAGFGSLALWIGVWGIVISLIAIYLGIDARNVAQDSQRRVVRTVELLEESRAKIETLEAEVRENLTFTEERLSAMESTVDQNEARLRTTSMQLDSTRKVASELIDGLTSQKEAITELASRVPAVPQNVQIQRPAPQPERPTPSRETAASSSRPSQTNQPAPTPAPRPQTPPRPTYTVQSGDTLVDIARRKNLSVPDLLDANPDIDPNVIRVGQKLNLPE